MFDQLEHPHQKPKNNGAKGREPYSGPLKGIIISAVGLLLGIGLCGAGALVNRNEEFGGGTSLLGAAVIGVSVLCLLANLIALLIAFLMKYFRADV